MTAFIALALVFALLVFTSVLWPLWRTAWKFALALLLALCVGAFALYEIVGTPKALDPRNRVAHAQENPDQLVEIAYQRMMADPQRHADAQTVALLERALQLDPRNQRGRWFFGVVLRQAGQAAQAAALWETLLSDVDANTAASLRTQIDAARKDAGLPALPADAGAKPILDITLDATPALRKRFAGDATVYVLAREPGGAPMPVAVQKHVLSELPLHVALSDADSPMPTRRLSSLQQVEVLARISASGDALHADAETVPVRISIPDDQPVSVTLGK